jgi:hypothetical protein
VKPIVKVAIGCGIALVVAGIAVIVAVGAGLWWAKGKAETLVADQQKIEALQKKADEVPFTRAPDGLIAEERLVKFLEIRKRVSGVYEKYKPDLEGMSEKKQADLGDVTKAFGMINELRLAVAQAQADVGMSQAEYAYFVENIYKTLWASEIERSTGKSASEAVGDAAQAMEQAVGAARREAHEEGAHGAEEQVAEAQEEAARALEEAAEGARALDVPKANIELFRKYEAEIKKYAMGGLELIGL